MRLALSFSVYAEQPSVNKRMRKEDEKLKIAIGKHYKKLVTMERSMKYPTFKFSESVIDLVTVLGFKKSKKYEDELSKSSESLLADDGPESISSVLSESAITRYTEEKYASINIDEEGSNLAKKIMEQKATEKREQEKLAKERARAKALAKAKKSKESIIHKQLEDFDDELVKKP